MKLSLFRSGVGETPVPAISPAVVNALARLTGKRYRVLPLVTLYWPDAPEAARAFPRPA
jgi:hypothetical protein